MYKHCTRHSYVNSIELVQAMYNPESSNQRITTVCFLYVCINVCTNSQDIPLYNQNALLEGKWGLHPLKILSGKQSNCRNYKFNIASPYTHKPLRSCFLDMKILSGKKINSSTELKFRLYSTTCSTHSPKHHCFVNS